MQWAAQEVPLTFTLGDRRLASVRLSLLVRQVWLTDGEAPSALPSPPDDPLPEGCDGFLVRSMPLAQPQPRLRSIDKYYCYVRSQYPRSFVDLSTGFDRYEAKFSGKSRSTIRRKIKRLAEENAGKVDWRRYQRPGDLQEFFDLALSVSRRSYQHRLFSGGLPDAAEFRSGAERTARDGLLRAYVLFHKGDPAAYLYCPIREGAVIYEHLGYAPAYASLSVGTVLQWLALQDLFGENRFRVFDFTEGDSEHKRFFATGSVFCGDVFFLRRGWRLATVLYAQRLTDAFSAQTSKLLERVHLKATIKRLLRFGVTAR